AERLKQDLQARQDAMLERYLRGLASELRRSREERPTPPAAPPATPPVRAAEPIRPPAAAAPSPRPEPAAVEPERGDSSRARQEPRQYLIERKRQPAPRSSFPSDGVLGDPDGGGPS
ncbi:MAG: hypothetical protein ACRDJP_10355, partial [Actinomycetota bacterium]